MKVLTVLEAFSIRLLSLTKANRLGGLANRHLPNRQADRCRRFSFEAWQFGTHTRRVCQTAKPPNPTARGQNMQGETAR